MLNKELLLMGETKSWAPYTHVVTVGVDSRNTFFGFDLYTFVGDMSPKEFLFGGEPIGNIERLIGDYSSSVTFVLDSFLGDPSLIYLGRSDTKQNFGTASSGIEEEGFADWSLPMDDFLFTLDDVGKQVPIWLSYDPPHINRKVVYINKRLLKAYLKVLLKELYRGDLKLC